MNLLNDKEIIHYNVMDAITKKIYQNNLPLTLKGGTALLFGYNTRQDKTNRKIKSNSEDNK